MPNTGRFYAPPAAAAAYRERYMRPYSTVSPPMGGAGLVAGAASAPLKNTMHQNSYSRTAPVMRRQVTVDNEDHNGYAGAYESRVRARPVEAHEGDRQWSSGYAVKQQIARRRVWSLEDEEEVSVHRGAPLSAVGQVRSMETNRPHRVTSAAGHVSRVGVPTRPSFESSTLPSALPRLSSLLNRSPSEAENYESDERFLARKRDRDVSPVNDDYDHQPKMNRRFYEDDVFAGRRATPIYSEEAWRSEGHAQDVRIATRGIQLPLKNPHRSAAQLHQTSPISSSSQYVERSRYPYMSDEAQVPANPYEGSRRSIFAHNEQPTTRKEYSEPARAYQTRRHDYYSPGDQHNESSPVTLSSPPPTAVRGDRFSPAGRYSESKEADCVIEAAADLVEERSPSKRESITKLLLKSKEFLKAKSLVRNRNNEIDWVATFLNVGFESSSIYSLMCPLRKGRWKVEEEKYTMELLRLIECGIIRLRHGQSIRGFIAKKLHSDDMRVLKKLSNCKMFHFARLINPRMSDEEEIDESLPNVRASLDRLDKLKAEFLRSVQLEALVAVRKYLSDTSIRDLLNARD